VIGALVKVDDTEIVNFLLQTEIIPLCLRIMETGSELSKTVATFIVQKILLDDAGLTYICATAERFYAVSQSRDFPCYICVGPALTWVCPLFVLHR
jgi:CCR4-NOT transcription complex subunit 9